jgi:hypothetical protein
MADQVTRRLIEKRRLGIVCWIFLLLFWGFNAGEVVIVESRVPVAVQQAQPPDLRPP